MVPLIDIAPLETEGEAALQVAHEIGQACRTHGFFYIQGHGVDEGLQQDLEKVSEQFFALSETEKQAIRMELGGKAWRGYFSVGEELTSGKPDVKEGIYFGQELAPSHPKVQAGLLLHGANLFPTALPHMRDTVLAYMDALTRVGHTLMKGIALSLGLPSSFFEQKYTRDPLTLFRIFHYPATSHPKNQSDRWGVGEHTDYGVLTILKQDQTGGLQIKSQDSWIEAPPIPGSFVCNIGDMLDRMTRGLYRSTPHRVKNVSNQSRYSYPFFFDPNFDAEIHPIDTEEVRLFESNTTARWDQLNLDTLQGTYGEYILSKVAKVFPDLESGE